MTQREPIPQPQRVAVCGRPTALNAAPTVLGWGRREPPSSQGWPLCASQESHGAAAEQPVGRAALHRGSWLRLAGCGPQAISHSRGPLPLCPFSLLPAIRRVPEAQEQPVSCQLQREAGTSGQEDLRRALGTKRVSFRDEEVGAEKAHCDGAAQILHTAKASPHLITLRPSAPLRRDSRSSSRAESAEPQGRPSRLPLACDSVKLLRKRARKTRPVQETPEHMAASPLGAESRLPEEPPINRSGLLPPIEEETGSPKCQPPKTKDPPRRKGSP